MNAETVEALFDEFAAAHARGEQPDVRAYLDRAAEQADELGVLIDGYLQAVPAQPSDEETVVLLQARLDHVQPLVAARVRRGLKMRDLADRLRESLGLGEVLRDRVADAYSDLERGQLDASRVDERVWEALRRLLGLDARRLATDLTPSPATVAYYREADAQAPETFAAASAERASRAPDEVDRLFGTPG